MQWNTDLTTQRIDCAAADLIDHLYQEHCPAPCRRSPQEVWDWLNASYPLEEFPPSHEIYARTALSVLEQFRPEEADYLPPDWEEKLDIPDSVRACDRGILALLLQGIADWRGVKSSAN